MKKGNKTNKKEVLTFAGKGGVDEKKVNNLKRMWKKWNKIGIRRK